MSQPNPTPSWIDRQEALLRLARRQLFFVGGAPRSGTTWLQHVLDSHPAVSCRGEGLFQQALADKLQAAMTERRRVLEVKNTRLFRHSGGYPLPGAEDVEALLGWRWRGRASGATARRWARRRRRTSSPSRC
jgi:hypothetical protein